MKFFNTAGPVNMPEHYKIDPLHRWDLDDVLMLIAQKKYFVLHAPRQTGKTSSLLALQDYLNAEGNYLAVYVNVEGAQAARNEIEEAMGSIIAELSKMISDKILSEKILQIRSKYVSTAVLNSALMMLSEESDRPVVLLIDEIDALVGDSLISVLRQIRAGYPQRPNHFPASIILCGVRDIKDYRIHTSGKEIITGGSAFNIKAESLRLGNFSKEEIVELYQQHTEETGQKFEPDCFNLIWKYTEGQPWLVNALGYEVTFHMKANRDRSILITPDMVQVAKNNLILSRQTHLDQLTDKLKEDRVRRILLPMILGKQLEYAADDSQYCLDLGLIKKSSKGLQISNEIYREVIPRELTEVQQENFLAKFDPDWVNKEGSINTDILFTLFRDFWFDNAGIWGSHIRGYQEAAPQLVTQAFLQRVANGSGSIHREYGVEFQRTDLMLKWKYRIDDQVHYQKIVLELKTINSKQKYDTILKKALEQTTVYAKKCQSTEAHLLIFDRDNSQNWNREDEIEAIKHDGVSIKIWKFS